jgi:hypothetical protein
MEQPSVRDGILRWETQDLVIPLAVSVGHLRAADYVGAATPYVQPTIAAALAAAAADGGHADEPTDFPTLFSRSRVRTKDTYWTWRVTLATVRLTRPVRRERLIPHGYTSADQSKGPDYVQSDRYQVTAVRDRVRVCMPRAICGSCLGRPIASETQAVRNRTSQPSRRLWGRCGSRRRCVGRLACGLPPSLPTVNNVGSAGLVRFKLTATHRPL